MQAATISGWHLSRRWALGRSASKFARRSGFPADVLPQAIAEGPGARLQSIEAMRQRHDAERRTAPPADQRPVLRNPGLVTAARQRAACPERSGYSLVR